MYDEDDKELKDQFYGRGDYAPTNPDLAVGSTALHPDSAPNPAFHDSEEMIRELVAAAKLALDVIHSLPYTPSNTKETRAQDALFDAIQRAEGGA